MTTWWIERCIPVHFNGKLHYDTLSPITRYYQEIGVWYNVEGRLLPKDDPDNELDLEGYIDALAEVLSYNYRSGYRGIYHFSSKPTLDDILAGTIVIIDHRIILNYIDDEGQVTTREVGY